MPRRRPGLHRWAFVRRLTVSFGVGAALLSVALAGSVYAITRQVLLRQDEHTALTEAYFNAASVRDGLRSRDVDVPALLNSVLTAANGQSVVEVDRRWYASSLQIGRDALPLALRLAAMRGEPATMWAPVAGDPSFAVGVPLPLVHAAYFYVDDATRLASTLNTLRTVLLVAGAATTAAGALTGFFASRRLAAPLSAVTDAAGKLATGDLRTRLAPTSDPQLAPLVRAFNRMVDALSARIERDARFAADVSHELRSPLTTLSTSLSVLQSRQGELSDRGRQALHLLTAEVARFSRLVEDLLDIARADAAEPEAEPDWVDVADLAAHVLSRPEFAGVALCADGEPAGVRADKRRLEQVLRNLLENAAAHAGGAREVTIGRSREWVQVWVDDAGPGVAAADRERIFERFARGPVAGRRGDHAGTGLGLALVREHVRAHGGRVRVEASPQGGARFVVELPAAE